MHLISPIEGPVAAARRGSRGFSLVELLVSLVVGLLVTSAAITFIASIAKANSEEIQVTRLTQELRSLSEVVSREIRRARYVADPIGLVQQGAGATDNDTLSIQNAGSCIVFEYDEPPDPPSPGGLVSRSIRLDNGRVVLNPAGVDCSGGTPINSTQIEIVNLTFQQTGAFRIDQVMTARLLNPPPDLQGLTRTYRQTIYIRSGQVN